MYGLNSFLDLVPILFFGLVDSDDLIRSFYTSFSYVLRLTRNIIDTSYESQMKEMISDFLCIIHIFVGYIDSDDIHDVYKYKIKI